MPSLVGSEMCIRDRGSPVVDSVLALQPTGHPHLGSFFFSFFPAAYMPQGFNVTDAVLTLQPTGWFLLTVFLFWFSIYLTLGFNDTDSCHGFSACPDFAVHRPSTFDPTFDLVSRILSCAYFSLTAIGPACLTTWRPPNRSGIVFCSRCALYAFWDLSPPLPAASVQAA